MPRAQALIPIPLELMAQVKSLLYYYLKVLFKWAVATEMDIVDTNLGFLTD